ncbi:beta-ketoacyl synthase chain length factor [Bordetella sp. FB-8]|uniref:beta-ketoacyl synthase chain length factor n=1 Tax=Bordetella sp. FB-8 TaxID=1159870 RepID=UPI000364BEFB|nr:beta-ketoacyl synthase chain length factor [Bordetella sp. FB-8]
MLTFSITHWQAWAPSIHNRSCWQDWAQAPFCPIVHDDAPRLDFLPLMQRRRLSSMARMVFACAWPLAEGRPPMPVVYASRHGETSRGFELLQALARDEDLSPTSFALSVHNAIVGQWSIVRQETCQAAALSIEGDGAEHAFLEAGMLQSQGHDQVLVILAEETPPQAYRPWTADVPFPYAAAFIVGRGTGMSLQLSPHGAQPDDAGLPGPLNLLRHLSLGTPRWHCRAGNRTWIWTCQR